MSQHLIRQYIEERSIPEPTTGCWIWLRSLGSHGYGNACVGRGVEVAHRVSYKAFVGDIPAGMLIQHSCDNHWCVAPHHLSIGDDATNALDKQRKGRAAKKLTVRDVRAIKERVRKRERTADIAADFGVCKSSVTKIASGDMWSHIKD